MTTTLADLGDVPLVTMVARGRQDAIAELYRRHSGPVLSLASSLVRNQVLAEDVVQEVFVRLWREPEKFDPERGALRSYLLTQTHGRSVDLIRAESSRRRREESEAATAVVTTASVEEEVVAGSIGEQVRTALADLDEGERQAIERAYFGGQSYRKVAAELGVPEGTIKSRIRTGMRRMRQSLEAAGLGQSGAEA